MTLTTFRFSILIFALLLWLAPVSAVAALPLSAVELIDFSATAEGDGIRLMWETGSELGSVYFLIERDDGTGFNQLTNLLDENRQPYLDGLVEAEGSPTIGATYVGIDATAVAGQSYTYQLVEVESDNTLNTLDQLTITAGATPTATPLSFGGGDTPTTSSPATATSTLQPTATATFTPLPPTNTPAPSATRAPLTAATTTAVPVGMTVTAPSSAGSNLATDTNVRADGQATVQFVAQTAPTPAGGYPAAATPLAPAEQSDPTAYPVKPTTAADEPNTPYPASSFQLKTDPTPTIVGIIGNTDDSDGRANATAQNDTDAVVAAATETGSGRLVLWGAFAIAITIFIVAVYGSIKLFVRKGE